MFRVGGQDCICVQGRRTGLYMCSGKEDRIVYVFSVGGQDCICVQERRTGCIIVYVFKVGGQDV